MKYAQYFYSALQRTIKNQVALKTFHGPNSNGRESWIAESSLCSHFWHTSQLIEAGIGGAYETASDIDTYMLAKENKVADQIMSSGSPRGYTRQ